jgi:MFS family permease
MSDRKTWVTVLVLSMFAWTVSNLDQSLFGYAVPGILAEYGVGLEVVGLILTAGFVSAAFMVILCGLAADTWGRRWTLAGLLALSAFFVGLHGFVTDLTQLTILRALAFGLAAGLAPITAAYVAEAAPARHRGMLMGVLQCGYPLGWFLAAMLAAPLLESSGWRSIFLIGFAVVPLAFLIAWRLPESQRFEQAAAARAGDRKLLDWQLLGEMFAPAYRRRALASMVIFFAFGCAYAGTAFFFPTFFMSERGYTPAEATMLVGLSNGIAIVGYLGAAWVGEYRMTRRAAWPDVDPAGALAGPCAVRHYGRVLLRQQCRGRSTARRSLPHAHADHRLRRVRLGAADHRFRALSSACAACGRPDRLAVGVLPDDRAHAVRIGAGGAGSAAHRLGTRRRRGLRRRGPAVADGVNRGRRCRRVARDAATPSRAAQLRAAARCSGGRCRVRPR